MNEDVAERFRIIMGMLGELADDIKKVLTPEDTLTTSSETSGDGNEHRR